MKFKTLFVIALMSLSIASYGQGLMGKLKQKAEQAAEKALEKKAKEKAGIPEDQNSNTNGNSGSSSSGANHPSNNKGGGLITTPPDVKANLADAESAFKTNSYGEARYAVQQAMLGVELEIGNKVLKSLPETVTGLPFQKENDQVTSTGWGWAGLTIQRQYLKDDKELRATIANNSAWMSALNMYLANGGYAQQTGGEQKWKATKVKGHKAVIEYDESTGYKLSVPLGQTSLIVWDAVNFASEQEVMAAANAFDIEGLIKTLGEK